MKEIYVTKTKYIWFGRKIFTWLPHFMTNNASRFVDDEKVYAICWLGFCFQFVITNYADIIHIYLYPKQKHSKNVKIDPLYSEGITESSCTYCSTIV